MACVYIPVQNSEEEVRVQLDQLPRDASDIVDILKAEQAPLDLWLIIAVRFPRFWFREFVDFGDWVLGSMELALFGEHLDRVC